VETRGSVRPLTLVHPITFVDTNVLVYAYDLDEPDKRKRANEWLSTLWRGNGGAISTQVMQEFYNTVTRKFAQQMAALTAREVLATYSAWRVVSPDLSLVLDASKLEERDSVSFWDALIVEAAKRVGATRLLTEDLQHGRRFGSVTVENPFVEEPAT
jgi:predicted nucleic acid-binding protein